MTELEELTAREEIKLLKARRDRAADTKDWDLYLSLHAPDHVSHNEGFPRWGSAQEMIDNVSKLMGDHRTTVHHSHTPEITFESDSEAKGIWAMEDMIFDAASQEMVLHGFGFYHETYEKRDGRWLFTSRRLKRTLVKTYDVSAQ
jgi:hypothetical protein